MFNSNHTTVLLLLTVVAFAISEPDHNAFLSLDTKTFDQLPLEKPSRRRLAIIIDKIDQNSDGLVTLEELKDWIQYTEKRRILNEIDYQWRQRNVDRKEAIKWDAYMKMEYRFMDDMDASDSEQDEECFSYNCMLHQVCRWLVADENGDEALTKEELSALLYSEDTGPMRAVMLQKMLEDMDKDKDKVKDKDKDGKVSLREYIGDMYRGEEDKPKPKWMQNARDLFTTYLYKDGDGFMDIAVMKKWIIPVNLDYAEAEARHLMYQADSDADHQLTKDEIPTIYYLFVGLLAMDSGEELAMNLSETLARHDEL